MFKDNKYTKCYFALISRAKERTLIGYKERHHVVPRCLGGSNAESNLVDLTAREHFICHLLLTKMHSNKRLGLALTSMMSDSRYLPRASKIYEMARKASSEAMKGEGNPMFGVSVPWTEERRRKTTETMKAVGAAKRRNHPTWKANVAAVQRAKMPVVVLTAVDDGREIARFANPEEAAKAIGCTGGNLAHAFRDRRPIGKKLKTLPTRCWVTFVYPPGCSG